MREESKIKCYNVNFSFYYLNYTASSFEGLNRFS
nr:MAG TPA: hypothetical protein [Caudoviricetes sp.]